MATSRIARVSPQTRMSQSDTIDETRRPRRLGTVSVETVTLAHGGGGKAMRDLIDDVFVSIFDNPRLAPLEDQASVDFNDLLPHDPASPSRRTLTSSIR